MLGLCEALLYLPEWQMSSSLLSQTLSKRKEVTELIQDTRVVVIAVIAARPKDQTPWQTSPLILVKAFKK